MAAISRVGLTDNIMKNNRICSRHFISGKPADLLDDTNPDWLPTQNLGHSKSRLSSTAIERWNRRNTKQAHKDDSLQKGTSDSVMDKDDSLQKGTSDSVMAAHSDIPDEVPIQESTTVVHAST